MKRIYILLVVLSLLHVAFAQQPIVVSGRIVDQSSGHPIPAATIKSLAGGHLVSSNSDGRFTIRLTKLPDTLIVQHMGYQLQRLPIRQMTGRMDVYLVEAAELLEEAVVNTGYQTLRPNEVTGAVQVLGSEDLQQQVGTDILQRLNNIAVGVRFDNEPIVNPGRQKLAVSVRGLSTINGPLDPLVVLDGFIYEGDIANIDPNSIDNITVLKDAAATSIWGARAGNGVIVLTTKRGRSHQRETRISINKTTIVKAKPDLYDMYEMPSADYIDIEEMLFANGYYERQISRTPFSSLTPATEVFQRRNAGLISPADSAREIQRLKLLDGRKAYADIFLENPLIDQYTISIDGGSTTNAYGFNVGYTTNKNETGGGARKLNLHLANNFRPVDKLALDISTYYTNSRARSGKPGYEELSYGGKNIPYLEFFDENDQAIPIGITYRPSFMEEHFAGHYLDWNYYPTQDWRLSRSSTGTEEIYSNASIQYNLFPFLVASLSGQYQLQRSETERLDEPDSYRARVMVNQFSSIDAITGNVVYNVPKGGIRQINAAQASSYTVRAQANVSHGWKVYRLTGIAGAEIRQNKREGNGFTAYGYDDDPLTSIRVDHVNSFQTVPNQGSSTISGAPSFSKNLNRFVSLYTNWALLFMDRYSVSASMRRDGANVFGAATNDKWKPFWHVGAFWDIAKEPFFRSVYFPSLKMRVTYGYSGNVDLIKTPLPVGSSAIGRYTNYPAIVISTLNDPTLRWEEVGTLNLGLDFATKEGVLSGTVDYYVKNGRDLYGLSTYDYTVWGLQGAITKNTASMRSSGLDISLITGNLRRTVRWDTRYLVSYNRNKTVDYYSQFNTELVSLLGSGNSITPIIGKPLNAISAYKWGGLDEHGNPQGYLGGELSTNYVAIRNEARDSGAEETNLVFVGSTKPQWFGSIINTFSYKQFSLSLNVSFKGGYFFRRKATAYSTLFSNGTAYADVENRWKQPGDERLTNMPSMTYPAVQNRDTFYGMAEIHILSGNHARLEYLNFSWHPEFMVNGRTVRADIFSNVSNVGIIWTANKDRLDPEFADRLSPLRTVAFGVRIQF